jgi:kynureninase
MPKAVAQYVTEELQVWGEGAVHSHFKHRFGRPWVRIEETVQEQSARVVGALKDEVAIMNTLTSNLHTLLAAFYTPTNDRHKILIESKAFPSDHYAIESQIRWHKLDPQESLICQEPRKGETLLRTEDILETIEKHGHEIAVVCFSGIQFYTGQYFEMEKITKAAQAKVKKKKKKKKNPYYFYLSYTRFNRQIAFYLFSIEKVSFFFPWERSLLYYGLCKPNGF